MKRNVNVFIAVVLVAVLCGGIIWLRTANDEKLGWNIHDTYGEAPAYSNNGAAYTNATFAGPSNDGGVMTLSPSRTMRHSAAPSYAGAYTISYGVNSMPLTSNLSPLTSGGAGGGQGLYTTSSKTFNSYGGGGNGGAAMGGAMSNGRSNSGASNPSLQGGAGVGSISPIAYSTARRSDMTVAAGENLAQMAAENPVMAMTNAANAGMSNGFYGGIGYTTVDSYGSAMYGSPAGIRGRRNVGGIDDNYLGWLSSDRWGHGGGATNLTEDDLRKLYAEITGDTDFSNEEEWNAFYAWFMNQINTNGYVTDGTYSWYMVPLSDAMPFLLLLCAIWALVVYRRTRIQESQCKEKSQL
mgnify:CR=1 FL=1